MMSSFGHQGDVLALALHEAVKVYPLRAHENEFTVERHRLAGQLAHGIEHRGKALCQITAIAGIECDITAAPHGQDAPAIELGLVQPTEGVEGIVSKLRDAPYRPGSRPEWLKIKAPGWTAQNRDRWEKLRG